ncbi:MAG: transposase [Acidobacteria bacterium]|nr:transposase [Acidobacteriota bacterium]
MVKEQFLRAADEQAMQITAYCFMPDHVHLVAEATGESTNLKQFIARAKQFSGYHFARASGQRLWQRYGYERVLRDDEATKSVVKYALENPVRAGLVESVQEYPFVGSAIHSREELIAFAYESG